MTKSRVSPFADPSSSTLVEEPRFPTISGWKKKVKGPSFSSRTLSFPLTDSVLVISDTDEGSRTDFRVVSLVVL